MLRHHSASIVLLLVLSLVLTGCSVLPELEPSTGDDGDSVEEGSDESVDTTDESADTTDECVVQPDACAQFVRCITTIDPSQAEVLEARYGESGSCWCGPEADPEGCTSLCVDETNAAIEQYPHEGRCYPEACDLEELDPEQPYGPVVDGECPEYSSFFQQTPFVNPFGLPGSFCAPLHGGIADYCPPHSQTTAKGAGYIGMGSSSYCALRCYLDPIMLGGAQCPCGARCQPHGSPDGEGNLRGLCTFE